MNIQRIILELYYTLGLLLSHNVANVRINTFKLLRPSKHQNNSIKGKALNALCKLKCTKYNKYALSFV